jgi:protein TonB
MTPPILSHPEHGDRYRSIAAAEAALEWRWFLGAVIVVPTLLAVGVYWLHHRPPGLETRTSDPIMRVHLVRERASAQLEPAVTSPTPRIANVNTDIPADVGRDVQDSPATSSSAPRPPPPELPARAVVPNAGGLRSVPSPALTKYQRTLLAHLERYRRPGPQGTVQLLFTLRRDGTVREAFVQVSSGQPLLDRQALEIILHAQPLPPIPAELPDQLTILLPVAFDLP